jgi:hypothetical protein
VVPGAAGRQYPEGARRAFPSDHPGPAHLRRLRRLYEAEVNCVVDTVPGTIHIARINANGLLLAIAGIEPSPSCIANYRSNPRELERLQAIPPPMVGDLFPTSR